MELETLKQMWQTYDQKLDQRLQVNKAFLKEVSFDSLKSRLWEFRLEQVWSLLIGMFFLTFFARYLVLTFPDWKYFIPVLILFLLSASEVFTSSYYLITISSIRFDTPILRAQKKLNQLIRYQKWEANLLYILIPLFWPLILIVFSRMTGQDIFNMFSLKMWIWNIAGSILIAIIIVWFIKKYPDKGLAEAEAFLKEVRKFEE
ncbi:MAG: hypothetical protein KA143_03735 [Saprospiraceae bacterium]|nr:hypothetical protein [Saprospiraceae bacterium]